MTNNEFISKITEIANTSTHYMRARLKLLNVVMLDRTVKTGTLLLTAITVIILAGIAALCLTVIFCLWYQENYGTIKEALLIASAFYVVLAILTVLLRGFLFSGPIIRTLSHWIEDDEENQLLPESKEAD